ncbi:MAG TPA: tail fiber protein [Candidatus Saccharimonadales bacterium]|nr:tail fiber protein [Candidatus Saccharimonadales bacterium]
MKRNIVTAILAGALSIVGIDASQAQQVDQYLGEVRLAAFNFCPTGWVQASGQLLLIQSNPALFSLLGTNFGGDGVRTFGLPNLSGRAPYGQLANGQGQPFGAIYGSSQVTLTVANLPSHTHQLYGSSAAEGQSTPAGALLPTFPNASQKFYTSSGAPADKPMAGNAIGFTGSNVPVTTQSPALSMNWCIATTGIYPSRP